jgi:ADP-ribosylglycohydrolase
LLVAQEPPSDRARLRKEMDWLRDRTWATLAGAAIGDALGGATEGWNPEQIQQRHGGPVTGIVGPYYPDWRNARPIAPYHKGDGHITDDTLMTHALVQVYATRRTHLDASAMARDLVPLLIGQQVWIPAFEAQALILQRIFLAEKWLVARLHYGHVDPREAGVGNIVNCGAAMYVAPDASMRRARPPRTPRRSTWPAPTSPATAARPRARLGGSDWVCCWPSALRPGRSGRSRRCY